MPIHSGEGKDLEQALSKSATADVISVTPTPGFSINEAYAPVKEYEGYHRYQPDAVWDPKQERRLVRKLDRRIMLVACIMFFALQLDRGNIKQALSDNMLDDLGLDTNDYNVGMTLFYVAFLLAELPSQLISKKLGADVWLPIQLILWSVITFSQFWLKGRTSFYLTRCLIGMLEGGFVPDMVLYCSYWYTTSELTNRLAHFWVFYTCADLIGAFLAFGILHLRTASVAGWRYLFMLEGVLTCLIGIASLIYLPASPTETKSFWSKTGWFTEEEEIILVNRVLRDDYSKGDMHNRTHITLKGLLECLRDYDMWPLYILGLIMLIPAQPPIAYLTLTLTGAGFSTFVTNLLVIPSGVLHIILLLTITYISTIGKDWRIWASLSTPIWLLVTLIALRLVPGGLEHGNRWVVWSLISLVVGYPYCHAIVVSWTSRNSNSVQQRAVSAAIYNMFVQAGSIIASNIYREDDRPNYERGNNILIAIAAFTIVAMLATKYYYVYRNSQKAALWDQMSKEEQNDYRLNTIDRGNKRLDFRFAH